MVTVPPPPVNKTATPGTRFVVSLTFVMSDEPAVISPVNIPSSPNPSPIPPNSFLPSEGGLVPPEVMTTSVTCPNFGEFLSLSITA